MRLEWLQKFLDRLMLEIGKWEQCPKMYPDDPDDVYGYSCCVRRKGHFGTCRAYNKTYLTGDHKVESVIGSISKANVDDYEKD